eukprot:2096865-Rhodomonas_salina.2
MPFLAGQLTACCGHRRAEKRLLASWLPDALRFRFHFLWFMFGECVIAAESEHARANAMRTARVRDRATARQLEKVRGSATERGSERQAPHSPLHHRPHPPSCTRLASPFLSPPPLLLTS